MSLSLFPTPPSTKASDVGGVIKLTPMLEQYLRAKEQHPDALLFFRLGDFYEMFFEDAERAAPILEIALTTRSKKDETPIPMCGVPHHSAQSYITKLLAAGLKVAICEQMQDPSEAKGIVERSIVRVVTPGTVTEEECLDPGAPNYLVAVAAGHAEIGLTAVDLSTGEVRVAAVADDAALADELKRCAPREVLIPQGSGELADHVLATARDALINRIDDARFTTQSADRWLEQIGAGAVARELGPPVRSAISAALWYLGETHRAGLAHLRPPAAHGVRERLQLDEATRRNLELLVTTRGERRGSLLWVIDQTVTPMGGRLLRDWLLSPLADLAAIGARLDSVEQLRERHGWRSELEEELRGVGDLERLNGRLAAGRVTPRDVAGLARTLERIGRIKKNLDQATAALLEACAAEIDPMPDIVERIDCTLADDPPLSTGNGNIIRAGHDATVDELRALSHSGKQWISEFETSERARTGIASLKVRYNRVFGYYIEITKPNLHLAPDDYRRKQTTANSERFITPMLSEYEAKVVGAEDRLQALQQQLFTQLVQGIAVEQHRLSRTAAAIARLDVFCGLAAAAERHRFARPRLTRGRRIDIRDGRHAVVEVMAGRGGFVPNDCLLDPEGPQIITITGPNMAGKSTYLRQVAQIVLLAQMGSFVPASDAEIGVVDRLFTRVGASDNLAGGESTFMVEMKETADILSNLTERSLVILDEIGRGTSTFDGISIAWAVAEYLHATPLRPLVLFATHYHELTDLTRTQERIENRSVAVREWKGDIVFLRRIVPGPASQSYGIEVAKLAGVPAPVIGRAKQILHNLERGELNEAGQPRLAEDGAGAGQMGLFVGRDDRVREELAKIDIEQMTPVEALTRLHALVQLVRGGD
jgi:DNA mismatch repair protein MutS